MTRFVMLAALLALAAVVAVPFAGAAQSGRTVTLHLVEKQMSFHYSDTPPLGTKSHVLSAGDSFQFSSALLTRAGKRAGTLRARCTVVTGRTFANATSLCSGSFGFTGGQLELETMLRMSAQTSRIAIVGGTGTYAGARGQVVSKSRGENSPYSDDTISFTLP